MSISQNKLTPLLVAVGALIICYVFYVKWTAPSAPVASGPPMAAIPQPGGDPGSGARGGLFGGAALPPTRAGDADNNAETLATVTASNRELRAAVQKLLEENKRQGGSDEAIAARVRAQLQAEMANNPSPPASSPTGSTVPNGVAPNAAANNGAPSSGVVGSLIDNGLNAATHMFPGIGGQSGTPAWAKSGGQQGNMGGLGYDGMVANAPTSAGTAPGSEPGADANVPAQGQASGQAPGQTQGPAPGAALSQVIVPMGYRMTGGSGHASSTLVRSTLSPDLAATNAATAAPPQNAHLGSQKPQAEPYFTIPENATLARSTAMTTLVGRVPIDGRVQDPMQFKLVVGRENLAASGQYVPDDIAGIVISGIAVGDMALSCTEGLIQSMTFVFDDGTIRTVSQRTGGASVGFGTGGGGGSGGGGVGGQSLASASKLGWISDEFGNPCIPGKFVTNAPAYLSDVVGAKALSMAGAAVASAQTTTTNGASALGSTSSSTVTGNQGSYVLGKVASAASDEVVSWLMRRLNNSFDAVVVRAGTRVAVHIDQSIHIDKEPDGRKLDYARGQTSLANQKGAHHGMD